MKPLRLSWGRKPFLPVMLQEELSDCGHACMAMVCHYWGHVLTLSCLKQRFVSSARGMTLRGMADAMVQLGFKIRALQVPLSEISLIACPAILHWEMNHFVVLKSVKNNQIIVHDPAYGVRHCDPQTFSSAFTGVVLEIQKAVDFKPLRSQRTLRWYDLLKNQVGFKRSMACLLGLSLMLECFTLLNPLLMQYVTDRLLMLSDLHEIKWVLLGCLVLYAAQAWLTYVREHFSMFFSTKWHEACSSNIMLHLFSLPLAFFEKRQAADLQSKIQSLHALQTKISVELIRLLIDVIMIGVYVGVMLCYSWTLSGLVLMTLGGLLLLQWCTYSWMKTGMASSLQRHAKAMALFLETLRAIRPLKVSLKGGLRVEAWRNGYVEALNADVSVAQSQIHAQVIHQWISNTEGLLVVGVGASMVFANQFSAGMLVAFLAYRAMLSSKSFTLIQHAYDYALVSTQLTRLSDVVLHEPERLQTGPALARRDIKGRLTLKGVSFQYDTSMPALFYDVNLDVLPGEKIAIVGPSGCGKSTLMNVMMGLLAPTSGCVYVDQVPLSAFGLDHYRHLIGAVLQEDHLLSGSVMENIAFFSDHVDWEQLDLVTKQAGIYETIQRWPMGYETRVGELGASLSGGQKQRLLLARALYKKPLLLFLDEATSHLDSDNEKRINVALKTLNITQVIVAHRQETIRMADRVIALNTFSKEPPW